MGSAGGTGRRALVIAWGVCVAIGSVFATIALPHLHRGKTVRLALAREVHRLVDKIKRVDSEQEVEALLNRELPAISDRLVECGKQEGKRRMAGLMHLELADALEGLANRFGAEIRKKALS